MKKIAALTMVRNDIFFLGKWTAYYGAMLGKENLYIFFDGEDQTVPECAQGCFTKLLPRVEGNVQASDRKRIDILSEFAAGLLGRYDMVIGTDIDEFVIVDPSLGKSLPEFLSDLETGDYNSVSALGCDVIQNIRKEKELDKSVPLLSQRRYARLSTRYTKASVLCRPVQWGSGFHRTRKGNYHIVPGLYLFHFGCADMSFLGLKMDDKDLSDRGWNHHLFKRRRMMKQLPCLPVRDWDKWTRRAVWLQTRLRPFYAWNKPAMLGMRIVVGIPERYSDLV